MTNLLAYGEAKASDERKAVDNPTVRRGSASGSRHFAPRFAGHMGTSAQRKRRFDAAARRVFVSQPVLLETEWVLRSRYGLQKIEITAAASGLLDATDVQFEDEPAIEEAVFVWKDGAADFADCLTGARNRRLGCRATATFDARAATLPGFVTVSQSRGDSTPGGIAYPHVGSA